ncbi:MAG TPA: hypothetical protein DD733_00035 [Clostridiales bacterium]|nr:ComEC/Rec2 family competence protein [Eubacteriales bacterium]HBR30449.1 hypothetical protein [Clostridiales bacterium]
MLKNRILAGWIIAFTIGVGIGLYTDGKIRIILFTIIGVLCVLSLVAHRFCSLQLKKAAIAGFIVMFGIFYSGAYSMLVFSGSGSLNKKNDMITVNVNNIGCYAEGGFLDVSLISSDYGLKKGTGVRFYYTGVLNDEKTGREFSVRRGDIVSCTIIYRNHDSKSLYSKGISLTAEGTLDSIKPGSGFFYKLRNSSENQIDAMFESYPDEVATISKTLIIGETTDMDSYVYEMFRNAGISHLLVVSGLQITLIVMSLFGLLEFFTVHRKIRSAICFAVLIGYALFTGLTPSVSRAAIMTGIMLLCMLVTRRADSITSLFLALLILLLVNPYNIFSVGLGLSFLSCLAILIVSPYLLRPVSGRAAGMKKAIRVLIAPLVYTSAATIFTFPVLLITFDSISYILPLTNLLITPLYTYLLIILIPCILIFSVIGTPAGFLSFIPGKIIEYSYKLLVDLYEADIGSFSSYIPYLFIPLIFSLAVILALCLLRRRHMYISVAALSLCFVLSVVFCIVSFNIRRENNSITVLNDSYSQKSLFIADSKECMYMELGGKRSGISTVYKHGYCRLDYYIMNGDSPGDIAKLESALAEINVASVYIPMSVHQDTVKYNKIKQLANSRDCDIIEYNIYTTFRIGDSSVALRIKDGEMLSDGFSASVNGNGRTARVYGGSRVSSIADKNTEFSDAVILVNSSEESDIFDDILCVYRCLRLNRQNSPKAFREGERVFDYSESDYVMITMNENSVEVNLNEP